MTDKLAVKNIVTMAGAAAALCIGAGFATGQEIMQFFSVYGMMGSFGALVIATLVFAVMFVALIEDGRNLRLQSVNNIWRYYCGDIFGRAMEWFTPLYLFLVLLVMVAGAGAMLNQYYGVPVSLGRMIMITLVALTVLLGIKKLFKIIGAIGPLNIMFFVTAGVLGIAFNLDNFKTADQTIQNLNSLSASPFWWLSGILYPGFMVPALAPFLVGIGPEAEGKREAVYSGVVAAIALGSTILLSSYAIIANFSSVHSADVPTLVIAKKVASVLAASFSIVLFIAIFAATVPLLWMTANRFVPNEENKKFKGAVAALAISVYGLSYLPYRVLINTLYPLTGYLGVVLLACIIYVHYFKKRKADPETGENIEESSGAFPG